MVEHRRLLLATAAACLVAALVYLNSLANGFALDDVWIVQQNPRVHRLGGLASVFSEPYWPRVAAERGLYRPVALATFIVDWELWNARPVGFHLVNILLHSAVTAILLLLLVRLGADVLAAAAGALVFAVHPVHVEAVANIVGRAELLAALFFLTACLLYVRARAGWGSAAAIAALYFLAVGSKEHAVTLPLALLILDGVRERRASAWIRRVLGGWRVHVLLVAALAGYFVLRARAMGAVLGADPPPWFWGLPDHTRILTSIRVWPEYLRLMLFPADLVPDYGPGVILPASRVLAPLVLLGLLTAGVAALVAWRARRPVPLITAGILWFAVTVLPVTGLLFPVGIILAERTLYLPSAGLALAIAGATEWLRARKPAWRRPAAALLSILLIAGAARTWTANPIWRDSASVLNHLLAHHPASYRAQWGLANELFARGDTVAATRALDRAIRAVPRYFGLRAQRGEQHFNRGRYDDAAADLGVALEVVPEAERPRIFHVAALIEAGRPREAAASAALGLEHTPRSHALHHLHARALARAGRIQEARRVRLRSIALASPATRWAEWQHAAGLALLAGDTAAAGAALARAAQDAPAGHTALSRAELAALLEGGGAEAIPLW